MNYIDQAQGGKCREFNTPGVIHILDGQWTIFPKTSKFSWTLGHQVLQSSIKVLESWKVIVFLIKKRGLSPGSQRPAVLGI